MRLNRLDLNLLVALDHLITLKSVSLAAQRMNMSQSGMSNCLNRLRMYFDDPLLIQIGRRMELTPKAETMEHSLRDILVRIDAAITTETQFDPKESDREFRLLLSDYTLAVLMPHLLAYVHDVGGRVRFRFMPQVEEPEAAVERGDADLMIAPTALISQNHPNHLLFEDEFVCVAWSGGKYGSVILSVDDYREARHIRMVPPNSTYSFDEDMLSNVGIARNVDVHCYSFTSLPFLVTGNDRLVTMHRRLATILAEQCPIAIHELPVALPRIRECMQWHSYRGDNPALNWLRLALIESARRLDPVKQLPQ